MNRLTFVILVLCVQYPAFGVDVFVSPAGDNDGPGTFEHPFRTIQQGVDRLAPGDTCYVREGVYRESVTIKKGGIYGQPVRLRAYPGERPVLDGTELIPGPWRSTGDGVFAVRTTMKIEQLFADNTMLTEARWPNCTPQKMLTRQGWAPVGPKSKYGELQSPELGETGVDWNGAMAVLNVAHQFWTWSRTVTDYVPGSDRLPYTITMNPFHSENRTWWGDDYFFLAGKREALDAAGEWLATAEGTLYLIPPRGSVPGRLKLRAKQRNYGIAGKNLSFVEISGINFFGCSFRLTGCEDCLVEYCHLLYPSYARGIPEAEEKGKKHPSPGTMVSGRRNMIRSCALEHCPNYGVVLRGEQNVIENSIVHDVNWPGTLLYPAVALRGDKGIERPANVARHNTFYNAGNAIVTCSGPSSVVEYNHVHHGGLISSDVSLIYTSMPAADGVEFRYNWVHDSLSPHLSLGIRGDDKTRGLRVHHNVVWNVVKDGIIAKGGRNRVYNNTCFANGSGDICFFSGAEPDKWWQKHVKAYQHQNEDSLLVNNCAQAIVSTRRRVQPPLPGDCSNNFTGRDARLVAPDSFDFRPRPDSPLVDTGRVVDGITAPFKGTAPDVGAYEFGGEYWLPGHRNGVWLCRNGKNFSIRLNLPILEPIQIRVLQQKAKLGVLQFAPADWFQPQVLTASAIDSGPLTFETDTWGSVVVADITAVAGLSDVRAIFPRPDMASARVIDSQPKFAYENSYTAEPIVRSQWRAYFTQNPPKVDGVAHRMEWTGWNLARTITLVSLEGQAGNASVAGEGYALFDERYLYLFVHVTKDGGPHAEKGGTGNTESSSRLEVVLANVLQGRLGPTCVLRAYPSGEFKVATDGGIAAAAAREFGAGVAYAANRLGGTRWSGEFRIPLKVLGIHADRPGELRLNLLLRQSGAAGDPSFAAVKTDDPPYRLSKGGTLLLDRSIRAAAKNLLNNGSFETKDLAPWRAGSNARSPLPRNAIECVQEGLHQDHCVRLRAIDVNAMKRRVIKWTYPIGDLVKSPGRYSLSYQVRVVGKSLLPQQDMGSFNSYLRIQRSASAGANLGQNPSRLTTTGDRWIRRDVVLNVPADMKPSLLSLQLHQATGTVLIDHVSLLRCDD